MMPQRHSTEAELDALVRVGERLGGFDPTLSAEWIDGALTALMAGPRVPAGPAEVVEPLFGDSWSRTFADPDDVAQALAVLDARWRVLRSALDPDALWEAPDVMRLSPLLLEVGEPAAAPDGAGATTPPVAEDAEAAGAEAGRVPVDADGPRLGEAWAAGFLTVAERPDWGWPAGDVESLHTLLTPVRALVMTPEELAAHIAEGDRGRTPTPEQLVDDACYAVQDLRLWWAEHAPRTAPRRAAATPGRNDPCPCGSGRKFKKCHGA